MNSEIYKSKCVLKEGEVLLYPTDTVWGIGCDATNESAVQKVFKIKNRPSSKSLILLVDSLTMLKNYVSTSIAVNKLLENSKTPTTVIYSKPKDIAPSCIAEDNTVAVRIVQDKFCQQLIREFGKPIVSTSANVTGNRTPQSFKEIDVAILESVDYVVNLPNHKGSQLPSKIIKVLPSGETEVLRA